MYNALIGKITTMLVMDTGSPR